MASIKRAFGILANIASVTSKAVSAKFTNPQSNNETDPEPDIVFVRKDFQSEKSDSKAKFCSCIASRIDTKTGKCSCGLPIKQQIINVPRITILDNYDPKNNSQNCPLFVPSKNANIDIHASPEDFNQQLLSACMHMYLDSSIIGDQ
jgi:hypothetical protein